MSEIKPVFICGCGHSGTSLLFAMIGNHDDVFISNYEMKIFDSESTKSTINEKIDPLLNKAEKKGKKYFLNKRPDHVRYIDKIFDSFPDGKVVICIRNPLDVCASIKKRTGNISNAISRYLNDNQAWQCWANDPRVFLLKYEDLARKTEATVNLLVDFLGLENMEKILSHHASENEWISNTKAEKTDGFGIANHMSLRKWQMSQPVTDMTGDWRDRITDSEYELVRKKTDSILMSIGYTGTEDFFQLI